MNKDIFLQEQKDWTKNVPFYRDEAESPFQKKFNAIKLKIYAPQKSDTRILDVGAGIGELSHMLAEPGRKVIAVDFAYDMATAAKQRNPAITYVVASSHALPFKNDIFDMVIGDGLFHHLKAQGIVKESLQEVKRVLKATGNLCIFDRNGSFLSGALLSVIMQVHKIARVLKGGYPSATTGHELPFSDEDIQFIKKSGFKTVALSYVSSLPFYLTIVFTNAVEYCAGPRASRTMRDLLYPLADWFENKLRSKMLTIEVCMKLQKE